MPGDPRKTAIVLAAAAVLAVTLLCAGLCFWMLNEYAKAWRGG